MTRIKASFARLNIKFFVAVLMTVTTMSVTRADVVEPPVADPSLESRLVTTNSYLIRQGDTLEMVSYLLYGHRSWWSKLAKLNPKLKKYGMKGKLPAGVALRYKAPDIGETYIVQKNDWLIRIAEWKYGSSANWENVYQKNARQISNPNLIRPGDRLYLSKTGEIQNVTTGKVVVRGLSSKEVAESAPPFMSGLMAGLLLFFGTLVFGAFRTLRPQPKPAAGPGFAPSAPKVVESEEVEPELNVEEEIPPTFKKNPNVELFYFDRSLIPNTATEIDRRPGYHSITRKFWKKYLKPQWKSR